MNLKALAVSKPIVALAALATIGAGAGVSAIASAQTASTSGAQASAAAASGMHMRMPGVFGKITAINGTTLTITSQGFGKNTAATTYTVDASAATVTKASDTKGTAPATVALSTLAVGDEVGVQGTVSGTTVVATKIMSGMMGGRGGFGGPGMGRGASGTVSAINGNSITVAGDNGTTYTVNATNAKVSKMVDLSISDIKVGDRIGAEGSVSGSTVTANHIMDGIPSKPADVPATN